MAGLNNIKKTVMGLCTPAQLYLFLSVLSLVSVFTGSMLLGNALVGLGLALVWTWVLNKICQGGYTTVSWILVLIPILGVGLGVGVGVLTHFL